MNFQEKLNWSNVILNKVVDIISSNEQFKKFLICKNEKCAAITNIFEKVAEEMNERATADDRKNRFTHSQIKNKFKKLVCECKSISLSQRITRVIHR